MRSKLHLLKMAEQKRETWFERGRCTVLLWHFKKRMSRTLRPQEMFTFQKILHNMSASTMNPNTPF